jgi:hypothetical protein
LNDEKVKRKLDEFEESLSLSPVKTFHSLTKPSSPSKSFLSKDSNLTSYVAWDVDGRVVDMESQFKELKEMVNTTLSERKGQDDALELAKKRGRYCICTALFRY